MRIQLALVTGFLMVLFAPRPAAAGEDAGKKLGEEEARLERKCGHEDEKDRRDAARQRRHPRPDNKWDELCVPPPPPPAPAPPPIDETLDPVLMPPPGMTPPPL